MNFLAIDTSGKYLSVVAYAHGNVIRRFLPDCALKHSVLLMDEIDEAFKDAHTSPHECDFFAAAVGPGSFTGIRIGISTVKGLCLACDKPAVKVTSLDCLAYTDKKANVLALVDAGHGCYYSCGYDAGKKIVASPAFSSRKEVDGLINSGFRPVAAEPLFEGCEAVDPCEGLLGAVLAKSGELLPPSALSALYLRKSSAEENRK